jgi:hypothetical protein
MKNLNNHPLENRADEAEYFARQGEHGKAAYRRAVEATTGSTPTWAKRGKPGRKRRTSDVFRSMASGDYSR